MPFSLNVRQMSGLILASAMLWMTYVQYKDRHQPEPRRRLLQAFGLGIGAWGLSVLGFAALEALGVPDVKFNERPWTAFYCFGIVGPLEEGAKVLAAYLFVFRWREFDEPMDGFVYASALALGFASAENLTTTAGDGWRDQLALIVALPITHVLFSAIWGFGIAHARFSVAPPLPRVLWQIGSIALGMLAHGLYDFLIFAYQATCFTGGLALGLWVFLIWRAQWLRKQALARIKS
jgi:RsiW-degrading membrane proteinase PrsW (M82 family)